MKKATAEMLIARKLQGDYDKLQIKAVELPKLGFSLELRKPGLKKVLDLLDTAQQDESMASNVRFEQELIYASCPMLHDKKLQKEFECAEPPDIVLAVLNDDMSELDRLTNIVLDFYGMGELEDTIKN